MTGCDRQIAMAAKQAALKSFGMRIREARIGINLTQEAVAERLLVTSQTVRNWEAGRTEPRSRDKEQLAALYEKPVEWFFSEEKEPPPPSPNAGQDLDPPSRDQLLQETELALRSMSSELTPGDIEAIRDFIRFVHSQRVNQQGEAPGTNQGEDV